MTSSSSSSHTNNWAVIVSTSRFWFNYRHPSNTLSVYHTVKRLGIPDSQILLILADDAACNARNKEPGCVYNHYDRQMNVYGSSAEVDYRGNEVTVESFLRLLTGRLDESVPRSKRLDSNSKSHILVYLTGHGGDGFLKFQDAEEITSRDLADAFQQMHEKRRYASMLFVIDTCQAKSMTDIITAPNVLSISSSRIGESSYSHHVDGILGVPVIDKFTDYMLTFLERIHIDSETTVHDFVQSWSSANVQSTPSFCTTHATRSAAQFKMTDFFGQVQRVIVMDAPCSLSASHSNLSSPQQYRAKKTLGASVLPAIEPFGQASAATLGRSLIQVPVMTMTAGEESHGHDHEHGTHILSSCLVLAFALIWMVSALFFASRKSVRQGTR